MFPERANIPDHLWRGFRWLLERSYAHDKIIRKATDLLTLKPVRFYSRQESAKAFPERATYIGAAGLQKNLLKL